MSNEAKARAKELGLEAILKQRISEHPQLIQPREIDLLTDTLALQALESGYVAGVREDRAKNEKENVKIKELVAAAKQMVSAYELSYDNEWRYEDGWGRSHRRDWEKDKAVRERLKKAINEIDCESEK